MPSAGHYGRGFTQRDIHRVFDRSGVERLPRRLERRVVHIDQTLRHSGDYIGTASCRVYGMPRRSNYRGRGPQARVPDSCTCSSATTTWGDVEFAAAFDVDGKKSDYVSWLDDRKWAHVRLEGRAFGDVPLSPDPSLIMGERPRA